MTTPPHIRGSHPAIALRPQSTRPAGRIAAVDRLAQGVILTAKRKVKLPGGRDATMLVVLGLAFTLCGHGASFQRLGGVNVRGVSTDGLYGVGSMSTSNALEAFRWTAGGGFVGLGRFPSPTPNSQGVAVSGDGSVVVGQNLDLALARCFWSEPAGWCLREARWVVRHVQPTLVAGCSPLRTVM